MGSGLSLSYIDLQRQRQFYKHDWVVYATTPLEGPAPAREYPHGHQQCTQGATCEPLCRTRQPFAVAVQSNKVYLPQEVLLVSTDLASRQINAIRYAPRRCSASSLTASAPRMKPMT